MSLSFHKLLWFMFSDLDSFNHKRTRNVISPKLNFSLARVFLFFHFLYLLTLFLSFLTVKVMALSLTGVKVSDGLIAHWGHHTIPYNTIQYHTIPHSTKKYYTIPHNTIWYHVIAFYGVVGWSDSSLRTYRPMLAINLWVAPRVQRRLFQPKSYRAKLISRTAKQRGGT